ncbi:MAG TPA: hypothetical protein VGT99_02070 [Gammaproteobacteria bacterium]|nr:hypothetical protein [Gammaproteobacteria bacterium]
MRIAVLSALLMVAPAFAADFPPLAPQLKALDVQSGHWIYHGTTAASPPATDKAGTFTWDEHCSWSANKLFLMCSFDNDWSGQKVQSLVVDSWNGEDKTYWHYEVFAVGGGGNRFFASKMTVVGDTWTEVGEDDYNGKKSYDRIMYKYSSPTQVAVTIEISSDQVHWKKILDGNGVKQPN